MRTKQGSLVFHLSPQAKLWVFSIALAIGLQGCLGTNTVALVKELDESTERPPARTLIARDFTTQTEVERFHWVHRMRYPAGDTRAGRYDEAIGGAVLPIIAGELMSSLRNDKTTNVQAPTTGRVFVEYEFYVPQSFYDLPWGTMTWNTIKTFRVFNNSKRTTRNKTAATIAYVAKSGEFWVRNSGTVGRDGNIRLGWRPPANTWVKIHMVWDYDRSLFEITAPGLSRSVSVQYLKPIDNVAPLLHSTSRSHGGFADVIPDTFLAYRNVRMGVE